jgi:outer membrane protein
MQRPFKILNWKMALPWLQVVFQKLRVLVMIFMVASLFSSGTVMAQDAGARVLTLDEAIRIAVENNRQLKIAFLEANKSQWEIAEFKTKRLPAFSTSVLASQLLNEVDFTFKEGTFGNFPSTGPIPNKDTKVTTPRQVTAYVVGQATQPLSQLYKIQLGVRLQELNAQLNSEKARAERQALVSNVKQAYYAVLQSESALQAVQISVEQYRELDRVVSQRLLQEAVLKSDSMDVKAKLAHEQYTLVQMRNTLDSRREYLNHLLGRDLRTEFSVEQAPAASLEEIELKTAQARALMSRPEIKQAEINAHQAEYSRRLAKADYIPDVGIAFNYLSPFNVEVLPKNVASIGLELKWEPWDWGRRKDVVNQKKIVETQAQAQLHETQSRVLMDVNSRFRKLEESRMLLGVAQAERDAARQKLREVTSRYEVQAVLLSDVMRQQATTAGASNDYQQALLGFWTARSEFEKSLGEDQ